MKTRTIIILDVGKTNKKAFVFDRHLKILEKESKDIAIEAVL